MTTWRVLAAIALAAVAAPARRYPVEIAIALPRKTWFAGEAIDVLLSLRNPGAAAWDPGHPLDVSSSRPMFRLEGPGGVTTFSPATAPLRRSAATGRKPAAFPIAPGATRTAQIPLSSWADVVAPGHYRLSAGIDQVTSAPLDFEVRPLEVQHPVLVTDQDGAVRVLFLSCGVLFEQTFSEVRPDLGRMTTSVLRRLADVGPQACDVFSPSKRSAPEAAFHFWYGQREGNAVVAHHVMAGEQRFAFDAQVKRLALPAQLDRGDLLLAAELAAPPRLALLRFRDPGDDGNARGAAVDWELPISAPIFAARSFDRGVVFASIDAEALMLRVAAQGTLHQAVRAPGAAAGGAMTLAVRREADGALSVALVYQRPWKVRDVFPQVTLTLLEARFDANLEPAAPPVLTDLLTLSLPALATAADFGPRGLDWAVLLEGGNLVSSERSKPSVAPPGLVLPLALLARKQATYLLAAGPVGARLEPLH